MKIVFIIKIKDSSGHETMIDICTNKLLVFKNVSSLIKVTDTVIFKDSPLFDSLPRYRFSYNNLVRFMNRLNSKQQLEMDLYRFVDEHEKVHLFTVVLLKWTINSNK